MKNKANTRVYKKYFPEFWDKHEKKLKKIGQTSIKSIFLYEFKLDADGIIYFQQKFLEGNKKLHLPITLIQVSLDIYNEYVSTKSEAKKELFLKYVEKTIKLLELHKGSYAFYSDIPQKIAGYKFKKPHHWTGCMQSGMFLNVLIRAHCISGDEKYLKLAEKMLPAFEKNVGDGGFRTIDREGYWWYEEFGAELKRAHVLNGFIYSLLGLYELGDYTKDKMLKTKTKKLFDEGIRTLENNLHRFDVNIMLGLFKWSRYDTGYIFYSGKHYHNTVHIPQLKILYEITKKKVFLEYKNKWQKYSEKYKNISNLMDLPLLAIIKLKGLMRL